MPYKNPTKLLGVWKTMVARCNYPSCHKYPSYGGRGVKVCDEWRHFRTFEKWALENGYQEGLSIDRIDNNKGYSPNNCRWVDRYVQQNNMRSNHFVECNGERHTISEWSRIVSIHRSTIDNRLRKGWNIEQALFTPAKVYKKNKEVKKTCRSGYHLKTYKPIIHFPEQRHTNF